MNGRAMNIDYTKPYFNMSIAACRTAGAIGGRRSARNRRFRMAGQPPSVPETDPDRETMAEATARIDALCPWLRGVEIRTRPRAVRVSNP